MEGKETVLPPSKSGRHQEEDSSDPKYQGILPVMPYPDMVTPAPSRPAPQASTPPTPYNQMPSFSQQSDYMNMPSLATFPQTDLRRLGAGGMVPSNISPLGHPSYSAVAPGTGAYSPLPPLADTSAAGMPPVQSYPGYGSYNQSPGYAYGSIGQGYPYGVGTQMPYSSLGAPGSQSGYGASHFPAGESYPGTGADAMFGGGVQAYPYYGTGYPQQHQYQGQAGHGRYGAQQGGGQQAHYQGGALPAPTRSYAKNPGRPYFKEKNRSGPDGANLFVFHIPNDMTNADLLDLFKPHGNVLSVRIMTEEDTGRGRGFGFVSYDSAESAARAIHYLHGHQIQGKRLKVQQKQTNKHDQQGQERRRHPSPEGFMSVQQLAIPAQQPARPSSAPHQRELHRDSSPQSFVPVKEYAGAPSRESTPVLPEPQHRRVPTPVLLPIEYQGAHESYQGTQESTTSSSPLADLKDMGEALPDLPDA